MNEFKNFHPTLNFIYFVSVIIFTMFFMHPICLFISLSSSIIYLIMLKGKRAILFIVSVLLPTFIIAALINPAFNHEGVTILLYLPSGNPLTYESILYGLSAGTMIVCSVCWFSCYNEIMTSDKFIYLFGRIIPSLSLVFSMTLRFIPKFTHHLKEVLALQGGNKAKSRGIIRFVDYVKTGTRALSATVTWAIEDSIETADSMRSRGYGQKGRTAFSIFKFSTRDILILCIVLALDIYVTVGAVFGGLKCEYFPSVNMTEISVYTISLFASYALICFIPIIIECREYLRWRSIADAESEC